MLHSVPSRQVRITYGKKKERKKVVLTWQKILRERIEGKRKKNRENEAGRRKFISLLQLGN